MNPGRGMKQKEAGDDRLFNWQFLAGIALLVFLVLYWPEIAGFIEHVTAPPEEPEEVAVRPIEKQPPGFEEQLRQALDFARKGARTEAHDIYTRLLAETIDPTDRAALLPRAAGFYLNGTELSNQEIELLHQEAFLAIQAVHPNNYYDYENVHRGLEKLYVSQNRYEEAAVQTRFIIAFYDRYYEDEDTRYLFKQPTTIRLANHMKAKGDIEGARLVYQQALEMTKAKGLSTMAVEAMLTNLDLPEGAEPVPLGPQLVAPPGLPPFPKPQRDIRQRIESVSVTGLTVERIEDNMSHFKIRGYANDNTAIAAYMRALHEKVNRPRLQVAEERDIDGQTVAAFTITVAK